MPRGYPETSVWLLPDANHEPVLLETIARLSALLGGAGFAPHVTLQGDIALPWDRLAAPLARLATRMAVQRWQVDRVECGAHFFRCLYLRFGVQSAFDELQGAVRAVTGTAKGLSPFPHLSLAYGDAHPDNPRLCDLLAGEFVAREIVFDRLAVCRSASTLPISEWECLAEYPLCLQHEQPTPPP